MSGKKVWVPSNKTEANTNSTNTETSSVDVTNSNTEVSVERPNNTRNQNPNKNQDGTTKPKNRNRNRNKKKILKSEPTGQTDAPTDSTENTDQIKDGKQEVGQSTTTKPTGQRKQQDKSRVPKMIRPNQPSFLGAKKQHQQSSQKDSNKSSQLDLSNQSTLAATIIEKLNNNSYECMICTDVIKRQVLVWNCTNCFSLFHLFCIKKWSKTSDDQGNNQKEKPNAPWRCPGCQFIYVNRPQPKCFCGKVKEPSYNGYLLPHSCGEICGKHRLGSDCPHPCNLICHPGHCPPCSAMGPLKTCYCGNLPYRLRCGQKDPGRSCGEVCRKSLNCSKHFCEEICHDGSCPPCQVKEAQQCYCGKSKQTRLCGSGDLDRSSAEPRHYSCGEICNKLLGCGNHTCQRTCHKGPCGDCALLPSKITSCPCGKIPLDLLSNTPRKSCKDEIKTCPNVCGKTLACGKHNCSQTCHLGPCPRCPETVKAPCRCHSTQFTVPCYQANGEASEVLCNKQCKASRICGRHQCGKRCCPSSPLADPYGADISGAHICNLICDRKLKCGKHKCDLLCHSGRCPPCHITMHEQYVCECGFTTMDPPIMCGTKLPDCPKVCVRARPCGHRNNHPCHPRDTPCPPCPVLTEKFCSGGHEASKNVPCNLQIVSCGRTCNKPLSCGVHQCKRICHPDACQSKAECGNLCHRKRDLCDHLCEAPCHGTEPCPKIPCKHLVMVSCPCKRRRVELECLRGGENDSKDNTAPRELLCDEQCEIEARNRRLAEAFGISLGERNTGSMYNDILIQLGKANISLVLRLERRFEELIKGHSTKSLLGSMDRIERRIVHEMAKFYQLDTESFDKEPHRSVTVTKRKDSKIPSLLLSTAISDYQKNGGVTKKETAAPANPTAQPTLYAVHLTDLESRGAATMLTNYLASFAGDYQLKWLSDTSVLVIFSDQSIMKTALHVLAGGPFVVKEWKEKIEIDEPEAKKIKPKVASGPPIFKTPDQTWHKDNNFFTALNDMDILNQPVPEKTTKPASVPASFPTGTAWADDFEEEEKTSMLVATTTSPSNKLVEEIPNDLEDDWEVVADKLIEKKEEETN